MSQLLSSAAEYSVKTIPMAHAREYIRQNGTGTLPADASLTKTTVRQSQAEEAEPAPWEMPVSFIEHDLPVFPLDTLPAWLRAFNEGLARETQTPVDLGAMLGLAACAGAVAGNVEIEARRGWREPLNLYVVAAQPPGNRKSAVFSAVVQPLERFEAGLIEEMRAEVAQAESEQRTLAARLDHLEKAAAKGEGCRQD